MSYNPEIHLYTSPNNNVGRKTYFWYQVYCVVLAAIYLLCIGMGVFLLGAKPQVKGRDETELLITGIACIVVGLSLFVPFALAPFLPRKPWNWIFGLFLIAIGMTSCCLWPAAVPLLIFWLKPETGRYFGRGKI